MKEEEEKFTDEVLRDAGLSTSDSNPESPESQFAPIGSMKSVERLFSCAQLFFDFLIDILSILFVILLTQTLVIYLLFVCFPIFAMRVRR